LDLVLKEAEKGSISIAFVHEALQGVQRHNLATEPLLRAAGISPGLLLSPDARVTPQSFGALWLAIAAALDDEFFGLDSRRMKVGSYALMCRLGLGCERLREAASRIDDFLNVILDDTHVALVVEGAEARIVLREVHAEGDDESRRVYAHETLFVLIHGLLCWLIGRRIGIRQARFAYRKPAWSSEYERIFCPDLTFNCSETAFIFDATSLRARIVQDERTLETFLSGAPGNFLLKYRDETSLSARVRRRLRHARLEAWPSCAQVARELHIGASSLHRKLEQEGTSFRLIRDELRRDLAIQYLTQSSLNIADIASAVGFAERSAFHRAFKSWTGVRPGAYRELHLSPEA
jgi:AraC-like DNA-binding protein